MGKRKKTKRTNNDLRYYTDPATLTPLKTWVNLGVPEGLVIHAPLVTLIVSL
jgi:hypothetical protein